MVDLHQTDGGEAEPSFCNPVCVLETVSGAASPSRLLQELQLGLSARKLAGDGGEGSAGEGGSWSDARPWSSKGSKSFYTPHVNHPDADKPVNSIARDPRRDPGE